MNRAMKDSGIDWIGEIPMDWDILRGKTVFSQRNSKGNHELRLLSATQKQGMLPQDLLEGVVLTSENTDLSTFKTVHKNDFVISLRSFQGGFEKSNYEGVCSPAYQVFYNRVPIHHNFFWLLFKSLGFIDKINSLTVGIREGKNILYKDFSNMLLAVPPVAEQEAIAAFLDRKCGEVDEMVSLQEQVIEELKAYKQSVITEAVTKGLNPTAPMKPSNIDWIGQIPTHWEILRLKQIVQVPLQYGANESGVLFDEKLPRYVRITDIFNNTLKEDIVKLSLTEEQAAPYILNDGDILFARSGGTVGKTFIYRNKYGRCAFAGYLIKANIADEHCAQYIYYYTLSFCYDEWKNQVFIQSTIQNIGADKYSVLPITVPPLQEQREIADYLGRKCADIDALIALKQQKIEELKQYKKSLIYEYVTGKKQV